jgi:hydrogenase/urease accessory protein HupE
VTFIVHLRDYREACFALLHGDPAGGGFKAPRKNHGYAIGFILEYFLSSSELGLKNILK